VDADGVGDDEFQAREADAVVRDLREVEGELRVADVHRELNRDRGIWSSETSTTRTPPCRRRCSRVALGA
jgi:hypothetical protein